MQNIHIPSLKNTWYNREFGIPVFHALNCKVANRATTQAKATIWNRSSKNL